MNEGRGKDDEHKTSMFLGFHKGQVIWMSLSGDSVSSSRERWR